MGHPDVVLPRLKTLIEIRGCFWHHHGWEWDGRKLVQTAECQQAIASKTNRAFGNAKFYHVPRPDIQPVISALMSQRVIKAGKSGKIVLV